MIPILSIQAIIVHWFCNLLIFIVRLFVSLLALIKPRLLEIAIISEIIFVLLMLLRHQNKAIVLYKNKLPIIKEESPLLQVDVLLK